MWPEIVAGLHEAIAGRVVNMTRHLGIEKDVVVTGGGAKNNGLVKAIEGKVGFPGADPAGAFHHRGAGRGAGREGFL